MFGCVLKFMSPMNVLQKWTISSGLFGGVVLCLCNGRVFLHLRRLDVELARENPKYLQSRWSPVGRKKGRESCVAEV